MAWGPPRRQPVFFNVADYGVGLLFIGLTCITSATSSPAREPAPERATFVPERVAVLGDKALGFFHIVTGLWLMYLMFADVLNAVLKFTLFI